MGVIAVNVCGGVGGRHELVCVGDQRGGVVRCGGGGGVENGGEGGGFMGARGVVSWFWKRCFGDRISLGKTR